MPAGPQPYRELEPRTQVRLWERWPHITDEQRNRFALIAQQYRELKAELDANEFRYAVENDVTIVEPYLAGVGCATAVCAAQGEPARDDGFSPQGSR